MMKIHTTTDWPSDRLLPAFDAPRSLDVYDIRSAPYDTQLAVTTLAGLVNRQRPRVYLLKSGEDEEQLCRLLAHIPAQFHSVPPEKALDEMLAQYAQDVRGMIIYDPNLMDSVNVATTMAGQRDALVVSPRLADVLSQNLQAQQTAHDAHTLPILADLRVYGWKNRLQAYRWAKRNLLDQASPRLIAGMDPLIAGELRSLLVAARAFVCWLDPRFTLPDPGNGWLMERCVLRRILATYTPGTLYLGWFIDERRGVTLTSKAALPVLASDHVCNMEVWIGASITSDWLYEIPASQSQMDGEQAKVYVSFTMSDGDNLQYCQHRMYQVWQDAARGSIPIGWTISPALQEAVPALAAYYAQTATANDELIAGPSGAGYILPSKWPDAQLDAYLRLTGRLMQRMGLSVVEALDELLTRFFPRRAWQDRYARVLAPFGIGGILSGDNYSRTGWFLTSGDNNANRLPVVQNLGLLGTVEEALERIRDNTPATIDRPHFLSLYILAWSMTPSDLKRVAASLDERYELVTPGRLLAMIAKSGVQA